MIKMTITTFLFLLSAVTVAAPHVHPVQTNTNEQGLTIFWRKYMSKAPGSGQNDLFLTKNEEFVEEGCVDKIKIKVELTHYLQNPNLYLSSI